MRLARRTLAALLPAAAMAQARWQMASAFPDATFHTRNIRQFLEECGQAVTLHSNASLLPMPQIRTAVQRGQVQLGEILLSSLGNEDPFFEVDSIPQLVTSTAQARRLRALSRPYVEARLARMGLVVLYEVPWPPSGIYSQVPVPNVEALRGARIRTFSAITNRFATLLGGVPTIVQAAEVPQAFATGVVNAMVTSAQTGVDSQAWDFARHFTPIGFARIFNGILIARRTLDALTPAQQAQLRDAAARAETRGWEMSDEAGIAQPRILAERGMVVAEPSAALLDGLAGIGRTIADEWAARAGEDGRRLLEAFRAAG